MVKLYEPPPTADEIMRRTAEWVARIFGVKVEFTVDDGLGSVGTTIIDRRRPRPKMHSCDVPGCLSCGNPPAVDA